MDAPEPSRDLFENPIRGASELYDAAQLSSGDAVFLVDWRTDTGPRTKIHVVEDREALLLYGAEPVMMRCGASVIPAQAPIKVWWKWRDSLYALMKTDSEARAEVCKLCCYHENRNYLDSERLRFRIPLRVDMAMDRNIVMIRNIL